MFFLIKSQNKTLKYSEVHLKGVLNITVNTETKGAGDGTPDIKWMTQLHAGRRAGGQSKPKKALKAVWAPLVGHLGFSRVRNTGYTLDAPVQTPHKRKELSSQ